MSKKILFVYPEYPETFWSFSHAMKIISKRAPFPPLGIMTVSSLMPKSWEKRLVDMNVDTLREKDILWADFICISAMVVQKSSALEVMALAKKLGKKIVVGGPLFSEENMGDYPDVSHFVLNEGEVTVPLFTADAEAGGEIKKVYSSDIKPDIQNTPLPDWTIIKQKRYATMLIQFSRGCPFDCEFCDITKLNGRIPRTKSPDQIVSELESLYQNGWRGTVFFVDDNFIGNKGAVKTALRAIGEWVKLRNYPFLFLTEASVNLAEDQELMDLMAEANFNTVFLGLETPDETALADCNKIQNMRINLVDAVHTIQNNGFQVQAGFIVGFDSDDATIFDRQIEFIQKIGVVTAMVGLLTALSGTKLHIRLKAEGRLLADSTGNNTDGTLNFIPKMDRQVLMDGYKRIIDTIYSPKEFYQRLMNFMEQYKPRHKGGKISFNDLRALLRSMWKIGVLHRSRFYFWKALAKGVFVYPKAFPEIAALLVLGYHFDSINKASV